MKPNLTETHVLIVSLFFALLTIGISILVPEPTEFQVQVLRTTLATAHSGLASSFPGILNIKISNRLRASGALAVFVLVYLFNPAQF